MKLWKLMDNSSSYPQLPQHDYYYYFMLYFINLTQLSHIKRKVRLHGEAAGIEPALSMLDNSKLFIQNLYNKLTKGYV